MLTSAAGDRAACEDRECDDDERAEHASLYHSSATFSRMDEVEELEELEELVHSIAQAADHGDAKRAGELA